MDVERTKVARKLLLLLDANILEVLAAEDDDASLGNEQGQLVLLRVAQLRELQTPDLGADARRQVRHAQAGDGRRQQVRFSLVSGQTAVGKLERLEGGECCLLIVDRKIVMILVLDGGQKGRRAWRS